MADEHKQPTPEAGTATEPVPTAKAAAATIPTTEAETVSLDQGVASACTP